MDNQNLTLTKDSKNKRLAILMYALGFIMSGLGIFMFLIPIIFLFTSKDEYIKKHAKNILNWQLTFFLFVILIVIFSLLLIFIGYLVPDTRLFNLLSMLFSILFAFGLVVLLVFHLIFFIIGAIQASKNKIWNYSFVIRFIKTEKEEKKTEEGEKPKAEEGEIKEK